MTRIVEVSRVPWPEQDGDLVTSRIIREALDEASSPEYNPRIVNRMRRRQARLHRGLPVTHP